MQIDTRFTPFKVALATNSTLTSITFPPPQGVDPFRGTPALLGVFECGGSNVGAMCSNGCKIIPFGAGSATNTGLLSVFGWKNTAGTVGATQANPLWVSYVLATFTYTLCTVPGIAGTDVNASQLFAGTITLNIGNANISNEIVSPTGNQIAHIMLDTKGAAYIQLLFSTNSSSTSNNALVAMV